ncbi:MAG: SEC-C metal-binding domain-containing protein, partial [Solirubrobacteraceae bacterium]
GNSTRAGRVSYSGGSSAMGSGALAAAAAAAGTGGVAGYDGEGDPAEALPVVEQRVTDSEHEVGRNDPCWCGSGKKFKKCHGA